MSRKSECPFCNLSFNSRVVYEDDQIVSFLSNPRLARGHALVIPKRHVEPPESLTPDESLAIMQEIERLRLRMLERLGSGVDVWQKSRPQLPQGHNGTKVDHIHFHVIPSSSGSGLYDKGLVWTFDHFSLITEAEIAEVIPLLQ